MSRNSRYLSVYLLLLTCVSLSHYPRLIWKVGDIWSPLDERAHYDYIDQLSSGRIPHPQDYITDYTLRITADYFGFFDNVPYDGTKESLGSTGKSYEAHQPPVYYILLAGPNYVLKTLGVSPPTQIRILRSFNIVFYAGTCVLTILVFRELSAMLGLDALLGYFVAFLLMSVRYLHRFHIAPDQLSPLIGAACIYLVVRLWRTRKEVYVGWSCLAAVLAFLTKYPNGLLLPFWGLNVLFFYHRRRERGHSLRRKALCLSPLVLPLVNFAGNAYLYGWGGVLKPTYTAEYFGGLVSPVLNVGFVTGVLTEESLDLGPLWRNPVALLGGFLGLIVLNYALSFHRFFVRGDRRALPLFIACQMAGLILLAALMLNPYVPVANWYHFRQYQGCSVFWYTALIATPFLVEARWLKTAGIVIGTGIATWMTWLWW